MRGHLRKRGPRKWQLVYDVPRGSDGRRKQRYETIDGTKKQAESRLTEILRSLDRGRYFEPTTMSVAEYLDLWLRDYAEPNVRANTLSLYRTIIDKGVKPGLGHVRLADLGPRDVQQYCARMSREGSAPVTVRTHHRVLRTALRHAVLWDLIARNPSDGVPAPKAARREMKVLQGEQIRTLLAEADGTEYLVPVHLAIYTGLRRSEILGLKWSDVDLGRRSLTVSRSVVAMTGNPSHTDEPKSTRSRRTVSLTDSTVDLLVEHKNRLQTAFDALGLKLTGESPVCVREGGSPILPNSLSHAFRRMTKRCGMAGSRFHDLRHTHATLLLESGVPVHVVQARLGHESVKTTVDTYGHVLPASDGEAGAAFERMLQ